MARLGRFIPLILLTLNGCFYVSKSQFDQQFDRDDDSWPETTEGPTDCAPDNPYVYPGAPDAHGDGCDSDCFSDNDLDGDDFPTDADCDDTDPTIYPCAPDTPGDSIDSDCDGSDDPRTTACPESPVQTAVPLDAECNPTTPSA